MKKVVKNVMAVDIQSVKKHMSVYTRTGDGGTTSLFGGRRVSKSDPIIIACGSIDELSSLLGIVISYGLEKKHTNILTHIQKCLHGIMAYISGAPTDLSSLETEIKTIEKEIDILTKILPPLSKFILPQGSRTSAYFHFARTVCRRAEQNIIISKPKNLLVISYMNRLSDLFFMLARQYNNQEKTI